MTEAIGDIATVLGGIAVAVGLIVSVKLVRRFRTRRERELVRALEDRLAKSMPTGRKTHLEDVPTVRRIAVLEDGNGESALVPTVRIDFETSDAPGMKLVFEFVADVLESIHPVLAARDERVHHYDVECTFGPDGLLVDGECRRVSVPPALADRLVDDENYRAHDLRRDVERADGSDDPAVLWGECRSD